MANLGMDEGPERVPKGYKGYVAFEATGTGPLRREFEHSVDEDLAWYEEDGVEPERPWPDTLDSMRPSPEEPAKVVQ